MQLLFFITCLTDSLFVFRNLLLFSIWLLLRMLLIKRRLNILCLRVRLLFILYFYLVIYCLFNFNIRQLNFSWKDLFGILLVCFLLDFDWFNFGLYVLMAIMKYFLLFLNWSRYLLFEFLFFLLILEWPFLLHFDVSIHICCQGFFVLFPECFWIFLIT